MNERPKKEQTVTMNTSDIASQWQESSWNLYDYSGEVS